MHKDSQNLLIDRGIALHKISRLITLFTGGHGYLNFMGNEFGHPEWIDFPREGNNWSYKYARRQWSLAESPDLRYKHLLDFDHAMLELVHKHPGTFSVCPQLLKLDEAGKVIAFERNKLVFIFNFHPSQSHTDYPLELPMGKYKILLDSDEARFGGHSRVAPDQSFFTHPVSGHHQIKLYIPSRCALVIAKN
jgi:1,4-alpha-glucan branching enzyme